MYTHIIAVTFTFKENCKDLVQLDLRTEGPISLIHIKLCQKQCLTYVVCPDDCEFVLYNVILMKQFHTFDCKIIRNNRNAT